MLGWFGLQSHLDPAIIKGMMYSVYTGGGGGVSSQNFQTNYPKHQGIRPAPPTADNLGDAERNAFSTPPTKNINQFMPKSCQDVWDSDLTNTKLFES